MAGGVDGSVSEYEDAIDAEGITVICLPDVLCVRITLRAIKSARLLASYLKSREVAPKTTDLGLVSPEIEPVAPATEEPLVICTAVPAPLRQNKSPPTLLIDAGVVDAVTRVSYAELWRDVSAKALKLISAFTLIPADGTGFPSVA